jgi:hypothetical protein
MHTGIISFCDRIAYNIKCSDAKDWILDQLENKYHLRILQKHWFRLDEQQFKYVASIPHHVCVRSNGNPYFLYFTRYEDVNQIMCIDKKVQPGYQKPRIIIMKGRFGDPIFENTLLEGEMVKDKQGQWIFLINDVILYCGKHLMEIPLQQRLAYAHEMLSQYYERDPMMDVCQYQVKKYVSCTQEDIEDILQFAEKLPYTNRGLYFVPSTMKYKPKLINFNDELIKTVFRKVKDCPEFMERPLQKQTSSQPESRARSPPKEVEPMILTVPVPTIPLSEGEKHIWLRKTEQPDVYDLYEMENSQHKFGIASVPTLMTSKMLRSVFKNLNVATSVCFRCKFDKEFQKWIPVQKI